MNMGKIYITITAEDEKVTDLRMVDFLMTAINIAAKDHGIPETDVQMKLETADPETKSPWLELTVEERKALHEKLDTLMTQANGVDIWLAPGGVLDVNNDENPPECFLDPDEEAHFRLGTILEKLGGSFVAHRDEGDFEEPLDVEGEKTVKLTETQYRSVLHVLGSVEKLVDDDKMGELTEDSPLYDELTMAVSGMSVTGIEQGVEEL
jgi:hypothetical protein